MKARITDKKEIAKGTLLVEFSLEESIEFKAGQHFTVSLINPPYNDARGFTRHFSITNSPDIKNKIIMATRITESAFKRSLAELPLDTEVEIRGISGGFILPEDPTKPLVFLSGGIGITPFISMIRHLTVQKLPTQITLLYSNRSKESTAFLNELQDLEKQNPNFKLVATMTEDETWDGEKRTIDTKFIQDYIQNPNEKTYYIAGPPPMVEAMFKVLQDSGVDVQNIITENFTGY